VKVRLGRHLTLRARIGMIFLPMQRDIAAPGNLHAVVRQHIIEDPVQG